TRQRPRRAHPHRGFDLRRRRRLGPAAMGLLARSLRLLLGTHRVCRIWVLRALARRTRKRATDLRRGLSGAPGSLPMSRRRRRYLIAGLVLAGLFSLPFLGVWFLFGSSPVVEKSTSLPAPDPTWVATFERVDNGMGFGLGAEYFEVHVDKSWL